MPRPRDLDLADSRGTVVATMNIDRRPLLEAIGEALDRDRICKGGTIGDRRLDQLQAEAEHAHVQRSRRGTLFVVLPSLGDGQVGRQVELGFDDVDVQLQSDADWLDSVEETDHLPLGSG
jgi:hypothetical protein